MKSLDYIRSEVLDWIEDSQSSADTFAFSKSAANTPTLYSTIYAVLGLELLEGFDRVDTQSLVNRVRDHQRPETGYFWDDTMTYRPGATHNPDYTRWHLTCCSLLALDALDSAPLYPLTFLVPFREAQYVADWLNGLNMKAAWRESNKIMSLLSALYHAYDSEGDDAWLDSYNHVLDWLVSVQDKRTGMWGPDSGSGILNGMAATYHFLMFFYAVGREVPYADRIIDNTLVLQLPEGHFGPFGASACVDLDAADILVNLSLQTDHRADDVRVALLRLYKSIGDLQGSDGGFPEHSVRGRSVLDWIGVPFQFVRHKCKQTTIWQTKQVIKHIAFSGRPQYSGSIEQCHSQVYESNIWSAWFRPLAMAMVHLRYPAATPTPRTFTPRFRRLPGLGYTLVSQSNAPIHG
jgi:hypothetical protein